LSYRGEHGPELSNAAVENRIELVAVDEDVVAIADSKRLNLAGVAGRVGVPDHFEILRPEWVQPRHRLEDVVVVPKHVDLLTGHARQHGTHGGHGEEDGLVLGLPKLQDIAK